MAVASEVIKPESPSWCSIGKDPCSQNGKMEEHYKKPRIPVGEFLIDLATRVGLYVVDVPGRPLEYLAEEPRERAA